MYKFQQKLLKEKSQLQHLIVQAQQRLSSAPEGILNISNHSGQIEYYSKNNKGQKRYLRKHEKPLAQKIAQRDYDTALIKLAEERIKAIENFLKTYEKTDLRTLYKKTNPYRRELISAPVVSDEEYVRQWLSVTYEGKPFSPNMPEFITNRGERVRSKSEKIIADKLNALGIPYRYEYPLVLNNNATLYPDFTVLCMPAREEVYYEHLGKLDDAGYVDDILYRINSYEKNHIYPGVNLFMTYESSTKPLNTRVLDDLFKALFCGGK